MGNVKFVAERTSEDSELRAREMAAKAPRFPSWIVLCGALVLALGGCAIERTDLSPIEIGASRETVERILGKPVKSVETEDGRTDTYRYNKGWTPPSGGSGCDPDCVSLLPMMITFMVIAGPVIQAKRYDEQTGYLRITYGPNDTVVDRQGGSPRQEHDWQEMLRQGAERQQREQHEMLRRQAEAGDPEAQFELGNDLRLKGELAEARNWWCLAANQSHGKAQERIGDEYRYGRVTDGESDYVRAYMWYHLAASNGDAQAFPSKVSAAGKMTPEQIAEAERLAREWRPGPCEPQAGAATSAR